MNIARAAVASLLACTMTDALAQQRADAVLIVNSSSAHYADAQTRIQPYLDHLGVPYTVLDIATTRIGPDIGNYALIIIGHAGLDVGGHLLDAAQQANLTGAVGQGSGLVNFDYDLAVARIARYPYVSQLFGFGYGWATSGEGVEFTSDAPGHYISSRHAAGQIVWARQMDSASLVAPAGTSVLARFWDSGDAFLVATSYGQGRAVQWASYQWMVPSIRGPLRGLDDILWRSLVWAARKPFVMQGLPSFLTMRVDDVIGGFWWVPVANEFQLKPWVGLFYQSITAANADALSDLVDAGQATAAPHATGSGFFYYDHFAHQDFPDATVAANFQDATAWHAAHGIPISSFVAPHFYEFGTNVFAGLQGWGVRSVGTHMLPGQSYGAPWLMERPFRLYDAGASDDAAAVTYADYLTIPGHPEYANQFFNCVTEIRDDAGYEWYPDASDVAGTVGRGTRQVTRALDSMALATLFTHEMYVQSFSVADWRAALRGITQAVAPYQPEYVTLDYACEYLRAKHDSRISSSVYDPASQVLTTDLTGSTDLTTRFQVFTESGGQVVQSALGIPAFTGSTRVAQQLAPGTTPTLSSLAVTPASATVAVGGTQQFAATGTYSDGSTRTLTTVATWTSSSAAVATVDSAGRATALAAGATTLSAALGAITGSASLTVQPPPLAVTTASLPAGRQGQAYTASLAASGGTPPYAWSRSAGTLPAGLTLSAAGGISGTPTAAGTASFTVAVTDASSARATANLSITIAPSIPPLAVTTTSLASGRQGQAYSASLAASGGTPPYAWSRSAGALPSGLSLSAGGVISGTPTAAGTSSFTVAVTDASSASATASLSITIAPSIPPLAVTTTSLASGVLGQAYSASLAASGGTPPYAWSLSAGALPGGLTLSTAGVISGTPAAAGTSSFTVAVSDAAAARSTADLSITVASSAAGVSIWPSFTVPVTADRGADAPIELGVKFTSDVSGTITGIRFYKSTANTGTHVGNLWTASGTRLATATFTGETASGWQEVRFATPVPIAANTTYVASYHTNTGHYARDLDYFAIAGYDNAPLHALASGPSGGNGVFAYSSSSSFPSDMALWANYWVDVVFSAGTP